jgi:two-component system C4-dicarboxylate transport sensor histidine kinase DctB
MAIATPALSQAVFNLVQKRRDAMRASGAGTVTIRARAVGDAGSDQRPDDGPGMTPDVRQRCLEPFFTTKPRGMATGMGLALVRGIITGSGAR